MSAHDAIVADRLELRWREVVTDWTVITLLNLLIWVRIREALFASIFQPIMLVLLFRYVLGGAIRVPSGVSYVDYLMPGIFVQVVTFSGIGSAVAMAEGIRLGFIERFRALPMARSALLVGRTAADMTRNLAVLSLITAIGYVVGFRVHTGPVQFLAAVAVLLGFGFALAWGFAALGMTVRTAEGAQMIALTILFPFTFASSAFVPVDSMPSIVRLFADHQPVTSVANAVRALLVGGGDAWLTLEAIGWSLGLLAVFAPLGVYRYTRMS